VTSENLRTEGAIGAEARQRAFSVLRKAWKRRSAEGFTVDELAALLGREKAQVSRVLNGHSPTMTLETLALFLDRLGYRLRIDCEADEDVEMRNRCAGAPLEREKVALEGVEGKKNGSLLGIIIYDNN
jgi:transcriptional regulator with XRE-family HTH domain